MDLHYENYPTIKFHLQIFRLALMHLKFLTLEDTVPSNLQFSSPRKEAVMPYGAVLPTLEKLL